MQCKARTSQVKLEQAGRAEPGRAAHGEEADEQHPTANHDRARPRTTAGGHRTSPRHGGVLTGREGEKKQINK